MLIYHVSVSYNLCVYVIRNAMDVLLHFSFSRKKNRIGDSYQILFLYWSTSHTPTMAIDLTPPCCCIRVDVFESRYSTAMGYCCIQVDKFLCIVVARGESHCICLEFRCSFFFLLFTFVQQMITSPMELSLVHTRIGMHSIRLSAVMMMLQLNLLLR